MISIENDMLYNIFQKDHIWQQFQPLAIYLTLNVSTNVCPIVFVSGSFIVPSNF